MVANGGGSPLLQPKWGRGRWAQGQVHAVGPDRVLLPCSQQLPKGCAELSWVSAPQHCSDFGSSRLLMGFWWCGYVWSCLIPHSLQDPQT